MIPPAKVELAFLQLPPPPRMPTFSFRVWWNNFRNRKTRKAYEALQKALKEDPDYAWGWHCNIAMPILDNTGSVLSPQKCNELASVLMKHIFDVDTSQSNEAFKKFYGR